MTKEYIQIGNEYRLTGIGGPDSNFYQVWKQINGGAYRKCNLNISILNKIDFLKTQYILDMIISQFVCKKLSTRGYILSSGAFKEFQDVTTENIVKIASDINSDETIALFYKTK